MQLDARLDVINEISGGARGPLHHLSAEFLLRGDLDRLWLRMLDLDSAFPVTLVQRFPVIAGALDEPFRVLLQYGRHVAEISPN